MKGEYSNRLALHVPTRDDNKGKTSMNTRDKKVATIPLCFKCGGHGHSGFCMQNNFHFCVEEADSKLGNYPREKTHNKGELSEECDFYMMV